MVVTAWIYTYSQTLSTVDHKGWTVLYVNNTQIKNKVKKMQFHLKKIISSILPNLGLGDILMENLYVANYLVLRGLQALP